MRMGTFLLGGILGAVAVVYINRNNSTLMSNISQAGQSVGNMMNKAKNTISNMDMVTSASNNGMNAASNGMNASSNAYSNTNMASGNTSENMSKVESIVNKDHNLKDTVNEILKENKQTTSTLGMQ